MALPFIVPAALAWIVKLAVVGAIVRVLLALGIFFISYTFVLPQLWAFVNSHISGLPLGVLQALAVMHVDTFMTMVLSAFLVRSTYKFTVGRFLPS